MKNILILFTFLFICTNLSAQNKKEKNKEEQDSLEVVVNRAPPPGGGGGDTYPWNRDFDGDGYGNPNYQIEAETQPGGFVSNDDDCDDTKGSVYPGAIEVCDGIDNDCDGLIDENSSTLYPGSINGVQTICYGGDPSTLGNSGSASGGDGNYIYQWQYSSNGSSGWTNIGGGASTTYNPPSGLTASRWYRRRVISCYQTKYTGSIKVTVRPNLQPGSISGAQTVCYGGDPSSFGNSGSASGGDGNYIYQWQYSSNGTSGWTNISGGTSTTYNPPSGLTASRWYRRRAISCVQTKYSNSIKVTIDLGSTWYADSDGDGFGNSSATINNACSQPSGYVGNDDDYNDTTTNITNIPPQTFYGDSDADGFGDPTISVYYSVQPSGYVNNSNDQCPEEAGNTNGCDYTATVFSDENYVYSRSYQTPMSSSNQISKNTDAIENITYFDGLGRPMQNIAIKASGIGLPTRTQPNVEEWAMDWEPGTGGTPFYNQIGQTSENVRVIGRDPFGQNSLLWQCGNDTDSNADGGWNTDYIAIDKNYSYRYSVWIKKSGSTNGSSYFGTQKVNNLGGGANSNPYFWAGEPPSLDQWYLLVGIVHPYGYTGGYSGVSGVYDTQGNKIINGTEFSWKSTTVDSRFRSYLFYSTDTNVRQFFFNPIVQKIDGSETSIIEIVAEITDTTVQDLVTNIDYDIHGRRNKEWLPYMETSGSPGIYRGDVAADTKQYYQSEYFQDFTGLTTNDVNAFSEIKYEPSPMNRPLMRAAPGKDWAMGVGHEIEFGYRSNILSEVIKYKVDLSFSDNTYTPTLIENGTYLANELMKTVTRNENHGGSTTNNTVEEFSDKQGRMLLKRTYADIGNVSTAHDTYYVYDDYGNLSYVIPPKVDTSDGVSATELLELCYQYKYDHRNRLVEKKIPGKGPQTDWESIVYNSLDQPVLAQDPNLKAQGKWVFTKYDAFGRVAYTGLINGTGDRASMVALMEGAAQQYEEHTGTATNIAGTDVYYTNDAKPNGTIAEIHAINYYDDYVFDRPGISLPAKVFGEIASLDVQGLPTGTKVRVLGTNNWITSMMGYDSKGRTIWKKSINDYLDTTDIAESELDFVGKVKLERKTHERTGSDDIVTTNIFTYDQVGRLQGQNQEINGEGNTVFQNDYDDLGMLKRKKVGGRAHGAPFTIADQVNVTISGKTISNNSSSTGWLSGFASEEFVYGNGYVEWTIPTNNKAIMVGFSNDNPNANYNSIDYALYTRLDGTIRVYENGSDKGFFRNYASGDKFRVQRIGTEIEYIHNNEIFYTSLINSNQALKVDASFYSINGNIENLKFNNDLLGGQSPLQVLDYSYNVRGWLKGINDGGTVNNDLSIKGNDLFGFKINYNDPKNFGTNENPDALFNGNIAQTLWTTKSPNPTGNPVSQRYSYDYDELNRIKSAKDNTGIYNLTDLNYDKNGNILGLIRQGHTNSVVTTFGTMDNLGYTYSGNRLNSVSDSSFVSEGFNDGYTQGNDYTYDTNGNMVKDLNKGIGDALNNGITYNHLNLPVEVKFDNNNLKKITYIYDAMGTKLSKVVTNGSPMTTDYAGNYIYENGSLVQFFNPEGYIEPDGSGGYDYVYQYSDHLGNVRLSYQDINDDGSIDQSEILQDRNYYPFGLEHKGYNSVVNGVENNYQTFQGKEYEKELGLETYDFGARNYDPALGRWMVIDPLADERDWMTPYNFVQNSPMFRIDPDGLTDFKLNKETGDVEQVGDVNDDPDRILRTDKNGNVKKKGEGFLGFLVKKSERGKAKVDIDDIEQGILSDGINLKEGGNVVDVGGEKQATVKGVESFSLKLSNYLGKEIGGYYLSENNQTNVTNVFIGGYSGNNAQKAGTGMNLRNIRPDLLNATIRTRFHTHLSRFGDSDRLRPSKADLDGRANGLSKFPSMNFIIVTNPRNVDFTNY